MSYHNQQCPPNDACQPVGFNQFNNSSGSLPVYTSPQSIGCASTGSHLLARANNLPCLPIHHQPPVAVCAVCAWYPRLQLFNYPQIWRSYSPISFPLQQQSSFLPQLTHHYRFPQPNYADSCQQKKSESTQTDSPQQLQDSLAQQNGFPLQQTRNYPSQDPRNTGETETRKLSPALSTTAGSDSATAGLKSEPEQCWVFIDNSNLCIQGRKYAAKKQKLSVSQDNRFRLSFDRLVNQLLGNRKPSQPKAKLYASVPPAINSVWKAIEDDDIVVRKFKKSRRGSEKQVDQTLAFDLGVTAERNKIQSGTIILISGDGDFMSTVKDILDLEFNVELVAWKKSCNPEYLGLEKMDQRFKIRYLEDILKENASISYYSTLWSKLEKDMPRDRTIVVEFEVASHFVMDEMKRKRMSEDCAENTTLRFGLPVMYKWDSGCTILFLIVIVAEKKKANESSSNQINNETDDDSKDEDSEDKLHETQLYDFTSLYNKNKKWLHKELGQLGKVKKIATLVEHCNQATFEQQKYNLDSSKIDEEKEESEYTVQKRKIPKPRCADGFECHLGPNCTNKHSEEERCFFHAHPFILRNKYKTAPCERHKDKKCKNANKSYMCGYGHNQDEARCECCKTNGHNTIGHYGNQCPNKHV